MTALNTRRGILLRVACLGALLAAGVFLPSAVAEPRKAPGHRSKHVLLISVDGMHGIDLINYVKAHPGSALAELASHGYQYNTASTSKMVFTRRSSHGSTGLFPLAGFVGSAVRSIPSPE